MSRAIVWLSLAALGVSACGGGGSSPTTPTATPAEPTATKTFSGTLAVSGIRFYSFTVGVFGNVRVTVESLDGSSAPSDTLILLGLGIPRGTDCATSGAVSVSAGSDAHLRNTLDPGIYCVRVADNGTLSAPVAFSVRIEHP